MTEQRYEAHADIVPGERERSIDAHQTALIALTLTDTGPITVPDSDHEQPDVICSLRPSQARALAHRLTCLADHASRPAVTR
jgi:hypothetical protein